MIGAIFTKLGRAPTMQSILTFEVLSMNAFWQACEGDGFLGGNALLIGAARPNQLY
jgi:hypothetical protein